MSSLSPAPDGTVAPPAEHGPILLRPAGVTDIPALLRIETRSFRTDRLSRRNFQHLLTKANAACLVAARGEAVVGYAIVLFNAGTSLARLYSFAVDPAWRGQGVARRLLTAAEDAARAHGCVYLRLEVRRDNAAAIALYKAAGFREFGTYPDYYEDHMEALRLEKRLSATVSPDSFRIPVPYYEQTLDFTCGPSCLMMAMAAHDPGVALDRKLELRLWRESTTVFMTSGHGGCGPFGLALAAHRRGFPVEVFLSQTGPLFLNSVRSAEKKRVIQLVHEDFSEEIRRTDIPVHLHTLDAEDLETKLAAGGIPIVLISSFRIYHEKFPHWVVVVGSDEKFFYIQDPYVDYERDKTQTDCVNMPIPRKDFERMARYGKRQVKAALVVSAKQAS